MTSSVPASKDNMEQDPNIQILHAKFSGLEARLENYMKLTNPIIAGLAKDLDALKNPVIEVKWKGVT